MKYIVDGHNLIPHVPHLSLDMLDDELELVKILQVFCRLKRCSVELFFDKASAGHSHPQQMGMVRVNFITPASSADDAIIHFIHQAGPSARHFTLVTSDHRIQAEARRQLMPLLSSEEFSKMLLAALEEPPKRVESPLDQMTEDEIEQWLEIFGDNSDLDE